MVLTAKEGLEKALQTVEPRRANMVRLYYGLDGPAFLTREIAPMYGLSVERTRQLIADGVRQLRHPARSRELRQFMEFADGRD